MIELERLAGTKLGEKLVAPRLYKRETELTRKAYDYNQICRNVHQPIPVRVNAWQKVLDSITDKYFVKLRVKQNFRDADYREPTIDRAAIVDDRVLESFSPGLKKMVDNGQINTQAAFGIVDYFLRNRYHNLTEAQVIELGSMFPPVPPNMPFAAYKDQSESQNKERGITGKLPEESWIIKRELIDILEITDLITKKYLKSSNNKTIFISELMRISSEALRSARLSSSHIGAKELDQRDRTLIFKGEQSKVVRNNLESFSRVLFYPEVWLPAILFGKSRNIEADINKALELPQSIAIEGLEHLPQNGPAIVAFSHMNRWKDPKIPPNWEMGKMIGALKSHRANKSMAIVAYLQYHLDTAPKWLRVVSPRIFNHLDYVMDLAKKVYGVDVVDVSGYKEGSREFLHKAKNMLNEGGLVAISPEGAPALEVLKPMRGLGTLAKMSGAPVVGVAFREDRRPDGSFEHKVIFTQARRYDEPGLPLNEKERAQAFSDLVMKEIAMKLPPEQQGIFRG